MVENERDIAEDNLLAVKGELTARHMLERFAAKVRGEENRSADETTTATLRTLQQYRISKTAQTMQSIVANCFKIDASRSSSMLVDLYRALSGHVHYASWTGPGIMLSSKLNDAQKCVILKYAKQVEKRDVSFPFDDLEAEEETASEP